MAATDHGFRVHKTRFEDLAYIQQDKGLWRFVSTHDGGFSVCGPQYRTKAELLADLARYATEIWGY